MQGIKVNQLKYLMLTATTIILLLVFLLVLSPTSNKIAHCLYSNSNAHRFYQYLHFLTGVSLIGAIIPVILFLQGLFLKIKHSGDPIVKRLANHKMVIGIPITALLTSTLILALILPSLRSVRGLGFNWVSASIVVFLIISSVAFAIYNLGLIIYGIKHCKGPKNYSRLGRNKILFGIFNLIILCSIINTFILIPNTRHTRCKPSNTHPRIEISQHNARPMIISRRSNQIRNQRVQSDNPKFEYKLVNFITQKEKKKIVMRVRSNQGVQGSDSLPKTKKFPPNFDKSLKN